MPFYQQRAVRLFKFAEIEIKENGVQKEMAKFIAVVKSLGDEALEKIYNLLHNPPAQKPYEVLNKQPIEKFAEDPRDGMRRLTNLTSMGNRTAVQFLEYVRREAGPTSEEKFVKNIFLTKLPLHAQLAVLSNTSNLTVDEQASLADRIINCDRPNQINELRRPHNTTFEGSYVQPYQ